MVAFHESLQPLLVDIDSVEPHDSNYNNGDVELITDSIVTNGMYRPIYVQKDTNKIVAGNHTWLACKELGATQIPVIMLDMDELTALRVMVGDNEIAKKAQPDTGQLVEILERLNAECGLLGTGMTELELDQLRALNELPLESPEHASWPTLCFQIHPSLRDAFYEMTKIAGGENERFGLLLKLAGWSG